LPLLVFLVFLTPNVVLPNCGSSSAYLTPSVILAPPIGYFGQVAAKAQDYLLAGVQQVWIIDPSVQSLTILYPDQSPKTFLDKAMLPADFLPGRTVTTDQLFH
jgi:Putative restriction endonuclease